MRTAMLRQLRLLIACLFFAVAARPAVSAVEVPRAVAAAVAAHSGPRAGVVPARAAVPRPASSRAYRIALSVDPRSPRDVESPQPAALARVPHRAASPLYLTHERFLL